MKWILVFAFVFGSGFAHAQLQRLVVAQDGSGDYATIQAAIDAIPAFPENRVEIHIRNGRYKEKLVVSSWKTNVSFIGEDREKTILEWDDYSGKGNINTFTSYTVLVQGNGFRAENLTFLNSAGPVGQAVALHVEADRCVIKNCRIIGNQDTLYAGTDNSRQFYLDCYIEGTTDFIFGPATAFFQNCTIHSKKNSYITAASTPQGQPYGFVFLNCTFTASEQATKVYLGRPWRPFAQTVYINAHLGNHIRPEGWHNWNKPDAEKTAFYAEHRSWGPGANPKARVGWAKQLIKKEVKKYKPESVLAGTDQWDPGQQ